MDFRDFTRDLFARLPETRYPDPQPRDARYTAADARWLRVIGVIPPAPMGSLGAR